MKTCVDRMEICLKLRKIADIFLYNKKLAYIIVYTI